MATRSFARVSLFAVFCCFPLVFHCGTLNAQRSTKLSFAGVELSEGSSRLLQKVETAYGRAVVARDDPTLPEGLLAKATLPFDGTPTILVNPKAERNEELIVHELMHLLGWAEGVPSPEYRVDDLGGVDPGPIPELVQNIHDQVFHAYFYPKMREMGLAPPQWYRKGCASFWRKKVFRS